MEKPMRKSQELPERKIPFEPGRLKPKPRPKPRPKPPPPPTSVDCSWTDGQSRDTLNLMCGTGEIFDREVCGCAVGVCAPIETEFFCAPTSNELSQIVTEYYASIYG